MTLPPLTPLLIKLIKGILLFWMAVFSLLISLPSYAVEVNPQKDLKQIQNYFQKKFPHITLKDYAKNHFINKNLTLSTTQTTTITHNNNNTQKNLKHHQQQGKQEWYRRFANNRTYSDCFPGKKTANLRLNYPYFNKHREQIITLPMAINECLENNGEPPFNYDDLKISQLLSYVNSLSSGKINRLSIVSSGGLRSYALGRQLYYSKRGKKNLSCADCHIYHAEATRDRQFHSSILGQVLNFPHDQNAKLRTLHQQYQQCQYRSEVKPYALQSEEYRDLEWFHTYMSNTLPW